MTQQSHSWAYNQTKLSLKKTHAPLCSFHCSTIHNSQDMEATQVLTNRGMDKEDMVNIHNGILLNHKKEQNNAICSNMDGTRDSHTE